MTSTIVAGLFASLVAALAAPGAPCGPAIPGEDQLTSPVVVLGETHGTQEIPAAFGGLVCRAAAKPGARILVGLEIQSSEQAAIDAFVEIDGSDAARGTMLKSEFWQREYQDGRSSAAMADLLAAMRAYRAAGLDIVVRALDVKDATAAGRDAAMGMNLQAAMQGVHPTRSFVLVGDVHSRVLKGYPWDPSADYLPFAAYLKSRFSELVGLSVKARRGTAWVCITDKAADCGPKERRAIEVTGAVPRLTLDTEAAGRTGWSGTLYLEELSASKPAQPRADAPGKPADSR